LFIIAVLITCHNRKEKTIQCLKALYSQKDLGESYLIEVFLVDDGCTDGTADTIGLDFPQVIIIQGSGELYWNRGMLLAWETAAEVNDFDYYLWLNDDTFLLKNGIETIFKETFLTSIVCGATKSQLTQKATYGAFTSKPQKLLIPNGKYQNADYCNGNCVLIPRYVFEKLGNLDPIFQHALGDFDYSLRARKKGIEIKVAPAFVGFCESHESVPIWRNKKINVLKRLRLLYSGLSGVKPFEFFIFEKRHFGIKSALYRFFLAHLRAIFPLIWKIKSNQ